MDLSLARGLSYYTGAILEVKALDAAMGSISGGGRYDNLTGIFGLDGLSGVGISFGADRIYDVLLELGLFPSEAEVGTQVLFANFSEEDAAYLMPIVARLRREGIRSEIYPEPVKMKKQMSYADSLKIPLRRTGRRRGARNKHLYPQGYAERTAREAYARCADQPPLSSALTH